MARGLRCSIAWQRWRGRPFGTRRSRHRRRLPRRARLLLLLLLLLTLRLRWLLFPLLSIFSGPGETASSRLLLQPCLLGQLPGRLHGRSKRARGRGPRDRCSRRPAGALPTLARRHRLEGRVHAAAAAAGALCNRCRQRGPQRGGAGHHLCPASGDWAQRRVQACTQLPGRLHQGCRCLGTDRLVGRAPWHAAAARELEPDLKRIARHGGCLRDGLRRWRRRRLLLTWRRRLASKLATQTWVLGSWRLCLLPALLLLLRKLLLRLRRGGSGGSGTPRRRRHANLEPAWLNLHASRHDPVNVGHPSLQRAGQRPWLRILVRRCRSQHEGVGSAMLFQHPSSCSTKKPVDLAGHSCRGRSMHRQLGHQQSLA